MRVLVTGGAGYIGSHTARLLAAGGHAVTVLDNLVYGHRAAVPPAARLVDGDLADPAVLNDALPGADAVVHFAAYAYVGESVTDPAKYYANNLVATLGLLDGCVRHGVRKLVFSSTCATYGVPDRVPTTWRRPTSWRSTSSGRGCSSGTTSGPAGGTASARWSGRSRG